jgi:plasmid stabilization system protein ParE
MKSVDRLINFPESGHAVPEFPDSHDRQVLMNPYRVIHRYEPANDRVFILAVMHSRRDIWKGDLA